jgi:hypothetical protein
MLIYAKIHKKHGGCIIERRFFEFCIQKSLLKSHDLRLNNKGIYELGSRSSRDIDCGVFVGLLSVSSASFTSMFVFINSSTTNRFFLHDFVVNAYVL